MVKSHIALEGFTGNDVSVYKRQVIEMDEGKAAQLVAAGKLAEWYNCCAVPRVDLSAMGAKVGDWVNADTRSLYKALTSGITKCTLDFQDTHFEWNVLAVSVTDSSVGESAQFSGMFITDNEPTLVRVAVTNGENGQINISMMPLVKAAG